MLKILSARLEKLVKTATKIEAWWKDSLKSGDKSDSSSTALTPDGRVFGKRFNYAMLLCYNGSRYYGMQSLTEPSFPTIEGHLLDALLQLRLINEEERRELRKFNFIRASRTDRGVSAARQVCNMVLPLGGRNTKQALASDNFYSPQTVLAPLNELLPDDIRVLGIKRVTPKFNARRYCDARHYTYTLPSYAFSPMNEVTVCYQHTFKRSALTMKNDVLRQFSGTSEAIKFLKKGERS